MKLDRDKLGVSIALLCAVHCLVLPFLVAFIPFIVTLEDSEWIHGLVLGIAIIPALESLVFEGYLESSWIQVLAGISGLLFMSVGLVYHETYHDLFIIGGIILGTSHLVRLWHRTYVSASNKECSC